MPETVIKSFSPLQLERLDKFGDRIRQLGVNLKLYDVNGKMVFRSDMARPTNNCRLLADFAKFVIQQDTESEPAFVSMELPRTSFASTQKKVFRLTEWKPAAASNKTSEAFAAAVKSGRKLLAVAMIDIPSGNGEQRKRFCSHNGIDSQLFMAKQTDYFTEILTMLVESLEIAADAEEQIERIGSELAQTYEELVLLYKMSMNRFISVVTWYSFV